jgi:hypothetical protein
MLKSTPHCLRVGPRLQHLVALGDVFEHVIVGNNLYLLSVHVARSDLSRHYIRLGWSFQQRYLCLLCFGLRQQPHPGLSILDHWLFWRVKCCKKVWKFEWGVIILKAFTLKCMCKLQTWTLVSNTIMAKNTPLTLVVKIADHMSTALTISESSFSLQLPTNFFINPPRCSFHSN